MNARNKMAIGSVLATLGALAILLSILLEWTALPRPWGFLLGFANGLVTGLGATLAVSGLVDRRKGNQVERTTTWR